MRSSIEGISEFRKVASMKRMSKVGIVMCAWIVIIFFAPQFLVSNTNVKKISMARFPDISQTHIVFCYGNDLWVVPNEGGIASRLTHFHGTVESPKFSPDGMSVAFTATFDGNPEIYTLTLGDSDLHRVTYHPDQEVLCDWTETGRLLFNTSGFTPLEGQDELYTVEPRGGLPHKLPVPYGWGGALSADGNKHFKQND